MFSEIFMVLFSFSYVGSAERNGPSARLSGGDERVATKTSSQSFIVVTVASPGGCPQKKAGEFTASLITNGHDEISWRQPDG